MKARVERDPLGEVRVPADAFYGAQTQRAVDNFPISGLTAPPELVSATVLIKKAAADANSSLGRLDRDIADAIAAAADTILDGRHRDQFVVDIYQAGAGTSHNMNTNEVLANLAEERLGGRRGTYTRVHPNDHVNMGQSTNDVFPTATRLAVLAAMTPLASAADGLARTLERKRDEFGSVLKTGRTHLQDAVPITLGQEFSGFAANVRHATADLQRAATQLHELNLGSTALGTGLNAGDDYTAHAVSHLAAATGLPLRPAEDRFRVTQSMGDVLAYSATLRRLAVEVGKIASDLRLLSMGPRAGLAEILLPPVQPGSSIMPGKVNPSVPEMVNQVCYQVIGCDAAILAAADAGQLELNVMMPVIAWNALYATRILGNAMRVLDERCVAGIRADETRCRELLDRSTAIATALSPYIGYAETADVAKSAVATGRSIRELVLERGLLEPAQLDAILAVEAMTTPGIPGASARAMKRGLAGPGGGAPAQRDNKDTRVGAIQTSRSGRPRAGDRPAGAAGPGARPRDSRKGGTTAAARPTVRAAGSRPARGSGSGRVAAARSDHGLPRDRGGKRRR